MRSIGARVVAAAAGVVFAAALLAAAVFFAAGRRAVPTAALNRSRYLLLVFSDPRSAEQRAADSAEAQEQADRAAAERKARASQPGGNPIIHA